MSELISKDDKAFLSSILRKDNERILIEIQGAKKEVVFSVGFEGGGFSITRYRCPDGKMYFRLSGGGLVLDEIDDEKWEYYEDAPTASFEGSLAELSFGKDLLALTPSVLHNDVREIMRTHIEELFNRITAEDRVRMGDFLAGNADEWLNRVRKRK